MAFLAPHQLQQLQTKYGYLTLLLIYNIEHFVDYDSIHTEQQRHSADMGVNTFGKKLIKVDTDR